MDRLKIALPLLACAFLGAARIQDAPSLTRAQHRIDQPMHYLYRQARTTLATMGSFIEESNKAFEAKLSAGELRVAGPMVFIYDGADGNPDTRFTLQIGMPVADNQEPIDGFGIVDLPKFESVSSVYCGPMSGIKDAYGALMGQLFEEGYEPTGIARETYLHWEGMDSENDITLISVGVKPK